MNPNWRESMKQSEQLAEDAKNAKENGDVSGGRRIRSKEKFLKSEVNYTNPSQTSGEICAICKHFINPHSCEGVAGYIRRQAWCKRFEKRGGK